MPDRAFVRPRSLAEQAAEQIRHRIVNGDFQLGEALSETALASELGVSKTPIREAFLRLKTEGLVDVQPQRGTFVFQIDHDEARVLSDFRDVLEIAALRQTMRENAPGLARLLKPIISEMKTVLARKDTRRYRALDDQFHRRLIDYCGNAYLSEAYATIAFRIQALRNRLSQDPRLNAKSLQEHQALVRLIERGATSEAVGVLRRHIARTPKDYAKTLVACCKK
ncbi:MAG: GntR family transcriptional regulator [Hyphomicrobiaceae bacterium]|nr:MAG: GntR family transcriptional regulator [Hyphomicrobiaceae bacterium]